MKLEDLLPQERSRRRTRARSTKHLRRWIMITLVLSTGSYLLTTPTLAAPTPEIVDDPPLSAEFFQSETDEFPTTNAQLTMTREDIQFINRIYQQRTHEIAYCGLISDQQHLRPWLADTVRADKSEVTYTTANCPTNSEQGQFKAIIHTHPSGLATLSPADKRTLSEASTDIMCVQAGKITTKSGMTTRDLRCYQIQQGTETTIIEIPVVVD